MFRYSESVNGHCVSATISFRTLPRLADEPSGNVPDSRRLDLKSRELVSRTLDRYVM